MSLEYQGEQTTQEFDTNNPNNYDMLCVDDTGYTDMFYSDMGDVLDEVIHGGTISYTGL